MQLSDRIGDKIIVWVAEHQDIIFEIYIPNDQIEIVNNDKILWQNPGF